MSNFSQGALVLGIEASSLQDLNNQSLPWLKRVNSSVHGTTHEIPLERHKQEGLQPIDAVPEYFLIREEQEKFPETALSHIWGTNILHRTGLQVEK
jgi:hypothetical protein